MERSTNKVHNFSSRRRSFLAQEACIRREPTVSFLSTFHVTLFHMKTSKCWPASEQTLQSLKIFPAIRRSSCFEILTTSLRLLPISSCNELGYEHYIWKLCETKIRRIFMFSSHNANHVVLHTPNAHQILNLRSRKESSGHGWGFSEQQ
jgi:hypothetical protein